MMILSIKYQSMSPELRLDQRMEDCLIALSKAASISQASVSIERLPDAALMFRTELSVIVPGADLQIQACDSTAERSFIRAAAMLEKRLRARAMQRARQVISSGGHIQQSALDPSLA